MTHNEQEKFWADTYEAEYQQRNSSFDQELGVECWEKMLSKTDSIRSFLECGSNIGRNLNFFDRFNPKAEKSIIELSDSAYNYVLKKYNLSQHFMGTILDSNLEKESFDLVFTTQVLIHIHPDNLLNNMSKMYEYSNKYILICEYFNRTPVSIEYRGEKDKLFKRDFGKLFLENFDVKLLDYGFHWGHINDTAGFDDTTWWLFEK